MIPLSSTSILLTEKDMATTLQRGRYSCPLALFALLIALGSNHCAMAAMVIDFEQFTPSTTATYSRLDFEQDGIEISIYRPNDVSFRLSTVGFGPFGQVSLSPFNGIQGQRSTLHSSLNLVFQSYRSAYQWGILARMLTLYR